MIAIARCAKHTPTGPCWLSPDHDGPCVGPTGFARPLSPAPAWCQTVARSLVTTLTEWANDGASSAQLVACAADLLEQELLDQRIIERLAQVTTVDTDQAALIALVREAQDDVARAR